MGPSLEEQTRRRHKAIFSSPASAYSPIRRPIPLLRFPGIPPLPYAARTGPGGVCLVKPRRVISLHAGALPPIMGGDAGAPRTMFAGAPTSRSKRFPAPHPAAPRAACLTTGCARACRGPAEVCAAHSAPHSRAKARRSSGSRHRSTIASHGSTSRIAKRMRAAAGPA